MTNIAEFFHEHAARIQVFLQQSRSSTLSANEWHSYNKKKRHSTKIPFSLWYQKFRWNENIPQPYHLQHIPAYVVFSRTMPSNTWLRQKFHTRWPEVSLKRDAFLFLMGQNDSSQTWKYEKVLYAYFTYMQYTHSLRSIFSSLLHVEQKGLNLFEANEPNPFPIWTKSIPLSSTAVENFR